MSPPTRSTPKRVGQGEEAAREGGEPRRRRLGQRAGQQRPARQRAHRRHVGQVHRQRLVPERLGIDVGEEMPALDQHVDRDRELAARRRREQRRIVAHAEHRAAARRRRKKRSISSNSVSAAIAADRCLRGSQVARGRAQVATRVRADLGARIAAASLSSTPLTYLWPSVPPYALASSTASLITTR